MRRRALGGLRRDLHRTDDPPEAGVGPDDRGLRVPLQQGLHLRQVNRLGIDLAERHVDVVVQDHHQPRFRGEVEHAVERRIGQAGGLAGDLRRDELLVDAELADPREDAGKGEEHPADVIHGVHVSGIEAGDHRIEARLLGRRQRLVDAGDGGVGERVVVERCIALQVVGRREVARIGIRPLLLKRNAEERRSPDTAAHDLQEAMDVDALLDVVRQVKVRVVELVGGTLAPCVERTRADREGREQGQRDRGAEDSRRTGRRSASHLHLRSEVDLEIDVEHRALGADRVGIGGVSHR